MARFLLLTMSWLASLKVASAIQTKDPCTTLSIADCEKTPGCSPEPVEGVCEPSSRKSSTKVASMIETNDIHQHNASRTSAQTQAPSLQGYGWLPGFTLQECQGDCDGDSECASGLYCYHRNSYETIPRCSGSGESAMDYCISSGLTYSTCGSGAGSNIVNGCAVCGLNPAEPTSSSENTAISSACTGWLGINDISQEGQYVDSLTGGSIVYTNWNSGEPNNVNNEDCTEIINGGKWNDLPCSNSRTYCCQSGSSTPDPTPNPTPNPTPSPTPSPTFPPGWPTPHPTFPPGVGTSGTGGVAATGDPHLQNVHGERFDLMKPGKHVLINIPRGRSAEDALLRVQADARRLGGHCADMYFQELNVTGSWAEAKQAGGYHYSASQPDDKALEWLGFGSGFRKVELKVVHGRTGSGLLYLNVYVKHLGGAGFAVGGLLGEDDHKDVMIPPAGCTHRASLWEGKKSGQARSPVSPVAMATFE